MLLVVLVKEIFRCVCTLSSYTYLHGDCVCEYYLHFFSFHREFSHFIAGLRELMKYFKCENSFVVLNSNELYM